MPLIYVTGVSGAGKSTVRKELQKRGYEAHDTDEDGFRGWYNLKDKKRVDIELRFPDASREWLKANDLYIKRERVEEIVPDLPDKIVFLCGSVPNEPDMWDLLDKVFFLRTSKATLLKRIKTRTNNVFGKHPDDLRDIIEWHKKSKAIAERMEATIIDAEQPISKVVDDILKASI